MTNDPDQNTPPAVAEPPAATEVPTAPAAPGPYAQPSPYAQPGAPSAYAVPPAQPTNVLAIVSLVASIIGFALVGVITGHIALGQIKKTGEQGRGLALAGAIIGYVAVAAGIIFAIIWIVIFAAAASSGSYNY